MEGAAYIERRAGERNGGDTAAGGRRQVGGGHSSGRRQVSGGRWA